MPIINGVVRSNLLNLAFALYRRIIDLVDHLFLLVIGCNNYGPYRINFHLAHSKIRQGKYQQHNPKANGSRLHFTHCLHHCSGFFS